MAHWLLHPFFVFISKDELSGALKVKVFLRIRLFLSTKNHKLFLTLTEFEMVLTWCCLFYCAHCLFMFMPNVLMLFHHVKCVAGFGYDWRPLILVSEDLLWDLLKGLLMLWIIILRWHLYSHLIQMVCLFLTMSLKKSRSSLLVAVVSTVLSSIFIVFWWLLLGGLSFVAEGSSRFLVIGRYTFYDTTSSVFADYKFSFWTLIRFFFFLSDDMGVKGFFLFTNFIFQRLLLLKKLLNNIT